MEIKEIIGETQANALKENGIDVKTVKKRKHLSGFGFEYMVEAIFHSVYDEDIDFSFTFRDKYDFSNSLKHAEIDGYTLSGIGDELQEIRDEELFGTKIVEVLNNSCIAVTSVDFYERDKDNLCVEMEFFSPAGEDFVFNLWFVEGDIDSFVKAFDEYASDFDPEAHAGEWYNNRDEVRGVPQSLRALLKDADAIKEILEETVQALAEAAGQSA